MLKYLKFTNISINIKLKQNLLKKSSKKKLLNIYKILLKLVLTLKNIQTS